MIHEMYENNEHACKCHVSVMKQRMYIYKCESISQTICEAEQATHVVTLNPVHTDSPLAGKLIARGYVLDIYMWNIIVHNDL